MIERPSDVVIRAVACLSKVLAPMKSFAQSSHNLSIVSYRRNFRCVLSVQNVFTAIGRFVADWSSHRDSKRKPWVAIKSRLAIQMICESAT